MRVRLNLDRFGSFGGFGGRGRKTPVRFKNSCISLTRGHPIEPQGIRDLPKNKRPACQRLAVGVNGRIPPTMGILFSRRSLSRKVLRIAESSDLTAYRDRTPLQLPLKFLTEVILPYQGIVVKFFGTTRGQDFPVSHNVGAIGNFKGFADVVIGN